MDMRYKLIKGIGETTLFSKNISNVLYMPTFISNLLYVSKMTNEFNCNVTFTSNNIIFQDRLTWKKIDEGKLEN